MINARHQKAEESQAGKCIPQAGWAATAGPNKQLKLISAQVQNPAFEPSPAGPDPELPQGVLPARAACTETLYAVEEVPSSAATPARMALASTQLHKLCTTLPIAAS